MHDQYDHIVCEGCTRAAGGNVIMHARPACASEEEVAARREADEEPSREQTLSAALGDSASKNGDGVLSALWWALDLLDQYDTRLANVDGHDRVYTPVHLEAKAKARKALDFGRTVAAS